MGKIQFKFRSRPQMDPQKIRLTRKTNNKKIPSIEATKASEFSLQ